MVPTVKIERIDIREIKIPLVQFFETSFGRVYDRDVIVVKLHAQGIVGYGEAACASAPFYSYETSATCFHILEDFLAPFVLHKDIQGPEELLKLLAPVRGHPMAKTGLEEAFWDIISRKEGKPLHQLLGGIRDTIYPGVSLGIQDRLSDLLDRIAYFLEQGYIRIKIKIKPGWDLKVVKEVRKSFGDILLMVDANGAYSLNDTATFKRLDEYALMMIEQPFAYYDLLDHARLQKEIDTPICLDESINNAHDLKCALALGSCKVVNIKPGRVGGLWRAKEIHDLAQGAGIPVWCGGMLESGIGRAHNLAISTLPNFTLPGDVSASDRYFAEDVIEPPVRLEPGGAITLPKGPGLGFEVKEERLEKYTVRAATVG